jgi:hypothetical protein
MGDSNLAVKVTADITSLQTQFAIAQATTRGLTSEMNALARESAKGIIDSAGSARLQQLSGDMLRSRQATAGFASELQKAGFAAGSFTKQAQGVGGAFESMASGVNTALKFTGIGLAIEGVRKLIDVVGEASQRANEIRSMSEVLGITATQFQAMQVAADEAGISDEKLFRAEEKLVTILNEARDGSGAAIEKLKGLGLSNDQIRDKSFGAAQMIAFLAERLNNATTAVAEMAAISKELGARQALAAEGIKQLGSNTDEWNKKAAEANGLSDAQLARLHEIGAWWGIVGKQIENAKDKLVVWIANANKSTQLAAMQGAGIIAQPVTPNQGHAEGKIDRSGNADAQSDGQAKVLAETQASNTAITKNTLDAIRDQIEATKQGSAARLALVRQFYQDSLAFYANDTSVDKVKEAHRQLVAEERQHGEELTRAAQKSAADLVAATREKASEIMAQEGLSKAQQLAQVRDLYAQEVLDATLTKEKRVEVQRSLNQAITAVNHEAASTSQAIARSDADTNIAIARLSLDAKRSEIEAEIAATQAGAARKLAALRELTAQTFVLDDQQLQNEMKSLQQQPAEYKKVYDQERLLKEKLVADLAKLDKQNAADVKRAAQEEMTARRMATSEILSAEGTLVSDLLGRRKSMSQSLLAIGQQLVTQEITNDLKAMTMKMIIQDKGEAETKALQQGGLLYHGVIELQKALKTQTSQAAQTTAA